MPLSRRRRRRLRRWTVRAAGVVLVLSGLLILCAAVLGWQALKAKSELEHARAALVAARSDAEHADVAAAKVQLAAAASDARSASRHTNGPLWSLASHLPWVGSAAREVRGLTQQTRVLTSDVLPALVNSVGGQAGTWGGRVDVGALEQVAPSLETADRKTAEVLTKLQALPYSKISRVDNARIKLTDEVASLAQDVREAAVACQVLPPLLGAHGPERLLVVAQNLSEERATGGLIGAYALLETDAGRFTVERTGSNLNLVDASSPVVDLGTDFQSRYGRAFATSTWRSANLTPDTPSAGAILAGLASRQLRTPVDGVMFIDPVALSEILSATGPVGSLNSRNAVSYLLEDVYARYPTAADKPVRDAVFQHALLSVVQRLRQPGMPLRQLVVALRHAARSGHLQLYASDPSLEQPLTTAVYGGALPTSSPYLSVVTQDVGGSKLDVYLHRAVSYSASLSNEAVDVGNGPQDQEVGTVTVQLTSSAPASGLPVYVTTRADKPGPHPVGQLRSWVSVYLGPGGSYSSATLAGNPVALSSDVEKGLSVFSTYVNINPGQTVTLVLQVSQPTRPGAVLLWRQQPRIEPDTLSVTRQGFGRAYEPYYEESTAAGAT